MVYFSPLRISLRLANMVYFSPLRISLGLLERSFHTSKNISLSSSTDVRSLMAQAHR